MAGVAGCAALVVRGAARRGRPRLARAARAVSADLRRGLLAPDVWPQLTLASVLVVAGHTATFVIAARVAGCTAPLGELVALLMVVQTAVVIPLEYRRVGADGKEPPPGPSPQPGSARPPGSRSPPSMRCSCWPRLPRALACCWGTPFAAVAARVTRASRDDLIRRRGRWRSFVADRHPATGLGAPLTTPRPGARPNGSSRDRARPGGDPPSYPIPLRFGDGYSTTATVVSFTGLTDAQQHVALELGSTRRGRAAAGAPAQ